MEIKNWSYPDFPEYQTDLPDVKCIDSTGDEVRVLYHPNVEYADYGGQKLTLQILEPSTRNHPDDLTYPIFVYVQGSAWMKQNVYRDLPQMAKIAALGYVVAVVEYRGSDVASFPKPILDAQNAVRFMKLHGPEYQGDPKRVILAGNSSGGHTAVYASFFPEGEDNLYPDVNAKVSGVVDFYGSVSVMREDSNPTTINHLQADSPEGMEMGHVALRENSDLRRKLSVECNISKDTDIPPVLIIHGTKDRTVNTAGSTDLYLKLKECGKEASYILIKGADHGGGEFTSPAVLKELDAFIKHVLA